MSTSNEQLMQKPKFGAAMTTTGFKTMVSNTLRDPRTANNFVASIISAVATNPALQECDNTSILASGLLGASLGLSPSSQLGQFYLVPYNDKKKNCKVAQFQIGYRGLIQLALRSGQYADLDAIEIHQGEYLGRDSFSGKPKFSFIEDDEVRDQLPVVGYMAYFEYLNGFRKVIYWSKEKVMDHADRYSQAFSKVAYGKLQRGEIPDSDLWKYSSYWYKDFDSMAKKTLLRQLINKWGIMSVELQTAIEKDNSMNEFNNTGEIISTPEEVPAELPKEEPVPVIEAPAPVEAPAAPSGKVSLDDL